jgi:hypothetical protein
VSDKYVFSHTEPELAWSWWKPRLWWNTWSAWSPHSPRNLKYIYPWFCALEKLCSKATACAKVKKREARHWLIVHSPEAIRLRKKIRPIEGWK